MDVNEIIKKRRSIRRFKDKPIPREVLRNLVDAGRLAPTAANLQPIEYIVISDPDPVEKIFPLLKWAGYIVPEGNPPSEKRPVAYIVVLANTEIRPTGYEEDIGAAIENIILSALREGIGTCWLGSIDRDGLRGLLNVPRQMKIDSVIALGYPDETPVAEDIPKDGSIKYYKDSSGRLHVPKKRLKDILHINGY